ncbi:MAG: DUF4149 domain-containing protein [Gemmatimonadetes bacterium]|nr:MAG: DUF4149 domain-containing protein [Gemmatimonadota bacterium]
MSTAYYLSVTVHVLAAVVWLGGMLFFALVGAPVLRRVDDAALRAELFDRLGRAFRVVGWICIGLLVATGAFNLHARGWWGGAVWGSPAFWRSRAGVLLGAKLAAVGIMVVLAAVHDFWLGPRAGRAAPGSAEALRLRRTSAWVARLNALMGVVLVYVAARLARGG